MNPHRHEKMTKKMLAFPQLFVLDLDTRFDGKKSAIKAGYSKKHAGASASRLLNDPRIIKMIEILDAEQGDDSPPNRDWVLKQLKKIVKDALNKQGEKYDPGLARQTLDTIVKLLEVEAKAEAKVQAQANAEEPEDDTSLAATIDRLDQEGREAKRRLKNQQQRTKDLRSDVVNIADARTG